MEMITGSGMCLLTGYMLVYFSDFCECGKVTIVQKIRVSKVIETPCSLHD